MKAPYFFATAVLLLASCQKEDQPSPNREAAFSQTVNLRYQQQAFLPSQTAPELTLSIDDIDDFRCPQDVTCAWAGLARVAIGIRDQSGGRQSIMMQLPGLSSGLDSAAVQANGRQYVVILREVLPYPMRVQVPREDKSVTLTVQRR